MAYNGKKGKSLFASMVDRLEGDKVVWIIMIMLVLISVVCMFSSTSRLLESGQTRVDIVQSQLKFVALGLGIVILCYNIKNVEFFRKLSLIMMPVSIILLLMLWVGINDVPNYRHYLIATPTLNGARRVISIHGKQIHVLEIAKISMVMYMAWAMDAIKRKALTWPKKEILRKILYLYAPFLLVFIMALHSSNSAALIIGIIIFLMILIGGGSKRDLAIILLAGILSVGIGVGLYSATKSMEHPLFERIGTGVSRVFKDIDYEKQFLESKPNTEAYNVAKDYLQQGYSARIAIHEGGFFGKGPGQSTQRYIVPDMPSDYMYSFIIEEYGLWGGILVLALYVFLMARGAIIVRDSPDNLYIKMVIAGLCLLIVGQAFLHMLVNVDIGPMTGQTLPMISHGNFAFLTFCFAFGVILSFSRQARKKVDRETANAEPILESETSENSEDGI